MPPPRRPHPHTSRLINPSAKGRYIIISEHQPHAINVYLNGVLQKQITNFETGGVWHSGPKHTAAPHWTPEGHFKVDFQQEKGHTSSSYGHAPMPIYTRFAPAVGFHVGNPAHISHGCVHLNQADAQFIFDFSKNFSSEDVHVWVMPRAHHHDPGQHRKRT